MVLPTLKEVLALPSLRNARVEIITGDPGAIVIRWVHSSEIFEMGHLLSGGELLLTTGLGLIGCSPEQFGAYVDGLADSGCAGVAFELGRSFFIAPPPLVAAAHRRDLALLTINSVVPFERVIEDFHHLLVERKVGTPRLGDSTWRELLGLVVSGQGPIKLLDAVSRLTDRSVWFLDREGHTVARSSHAETAGTTPASSIDVRGPFGSVGRLVVGGPQTPSTRSILSAASVAMALEYTRNPTGEHRPSLAQAALADILAGLTLSHRDVVTRCNEAGWAPTERNHVLAIALDVDVRVPARELIPDVQLAVHRHFGDGLVGAAENHVIILAQGWKRSEQARARATATELFRALEGELHIGTIRTVGMATPFLDLGNASAALREARNILRLARRVDARRRVILACDTSLHRVVQLLPDTDASALVKNQLGALLAHDSQRSSSLIRTLDTFINCGGSKAGTAAKLGIRRQSLYARLVRIEALAGVSLDDHLHVATLTLALVAWRMQTGLDPQVANLRSPGLVDGTPPSGS